MYTHLIAQTLDDLGTTPVNDAAVNAAGTAALGAFAGLMIAAWAIGLVALAIWIWALVDVIRRQFIKQDDKTLWMILVIVGLFIGNPIIPIIYLIVGRKKGTIPGSAQAPVTQTPPAQAPAQPAPEEHHDDNPPTQTPPAA